MEKNDQQRNELWFNREGRRKFKRINIFHLSEPINIKVKSWEMAVPGILMDISTNGVGILSFKEIDLNKVVNLKLNLEKIKTDNIIAKVIWIKQVAKTYRIGLQFINISSKDFFQIQNFIEKYNLTDCQ